MDPSSQDLHPKTGARFTFERLSDAPPHRYRVDAYLPDAKAWHGELTWVDDKAALEQRSSTADDPAWVEAQALKLARVLHRDPKPRLVRWRG